MERGELRQLALATGCAVERGDFVFLRDPQGSVADQEQFARLNVAPSVPCKDGAGWLCLPTGGTSGGLRFARHDEWTLNAAVRGFCDHYGVSRVNALDVLPPYHVSGFMARVRCAATGGDHVGWSWKQLESGEWPVLLPREGGWFLSLVPTQLQRLLAGKSAVERLKLFRAVFIGGGPLWPALADAAQAAGVPVAICYGMTETAAMIAAQRPRGFAGGDRSCGEVMSQARVDIVDADIGAILPVGERGLVRISGGNVFRGYWPEAGETQVLLTEDLGFLDAEGRLNILGRRDAVIITGGKKVSPAEVEVVLRASGEFDDVAVIGLPDAEWGQVVVACHPCAGKLDTERIDAALSMLAPYKRPKRFIALVVWPRNAQGKLNRAALTAAASTSLHPGEQGGR